MDTMEETNKFIEKLRTILSRTISLRGLTANEKLECMELCKKLSEKSMAMISALLEGKISLAAYEVRMEALADLLEEMDLLQQNQEMNYKPNESPNTLKS